MGYVMYQNIDDSKPGKDVTSTSANSSGLKRSPLQYSTVDCEVLALKFATDGCGYNLEGAPEINVFSDCNTLEGIIGKPLGEIKKKEK